MMCHDIDNLISSKPGNALPVPEAVAHLDTCDKCRALISVLNAEWKLAGPTAVHLERIQARIVETLKPVRPLATARFFLFACAIIFLCIVAIGVMQFGTQGWGTLGIGQRVAVFGTLAASAVLLGVSMVGQMAPGSKYAISPAALPVGILTVLLILIAATFRPQADPGFVENGLTCLKNGFTYAIPGGLLFWLLARRGAMLFPKLIGAATGGLADLIGLSVLEINCTNLDVYHILIWHGGVVVTSSVAGALMGAAVEYIDRLASHKVS
jgi:Negative regulator of sigma F